MHRKFVTAPRRRRRRAARPDRLFLISRAAARRRRERASARVDVGRGDATPASAAASTGGASSIVGSPVQRRRPTSSTTTLQGALKGKSLSGVNIAMVVNVAADYWKAGQAGFQAGCKALGIRRALHLLRAAERHADRAGLRARDAARRASPGTRSPRSTRRRRRTRSPPTCGKGRRSCSRSTRRCRAPPRPASTSAPRTPTPATTPAWR